MQQPDPLVSPPDKTHSFLWIFLLVLSLLVAGLLFLRYYEPSVSTQTVSSGKNADEPTVSVLAVPKPKYLEALLPEVIHGLAVQDLDKTGEHKLVAWAQWAKKPLFEGFRSRIELIEAKPGTAARSIWQSKEEQLYEPRIKVVPDWTCQGHQLYVVLRQAGAAAELADLLWFDDGAIHQLPTMEGDFFEIGKLGTDDEHQLICHARPGPQGLDIPEIYLWNGEKFVAHSREFPSFYYKLAKKNSDILNDKDVAVCNLYGQSVLLERSGRTKEALALLKRIRKDIANSDDPALISSYNQLLSRLEKS